MVTLNKANILANIWETFYDEIKSQVTSVTTGAGVTYTVQTVTSSFPDSEIDNKSAYPIIILNPVDVSWSDKTFTKKSTNGTIVIEAYSVNSESCDMLLDAIIEAIEQYRGTAAGLKLHLINLESTDSDSATRGGFKVHLRTCTFAFRYYLTKSYI